MKYQAFMEKIMQQLTEYKGVVDTLATSYLEEVEKRDKEFESMSGKYTPEYISESRRNWKPPKDYSGKSARQGRNIKRLPWHTSTRFKRN